MNTLKELSFIKTEGANISDSELKNLLIYTLKKEYNHINIDLDNFCEGVINSYRDLSSFIEGTYIMGEMDTFMRVACFLISCFEFCARSDSPSYPSYQPYSFIGIDCALSLIQKPYVYIGKKYDEMKPLEVCDFEQAFLEKPDLLSYIKKGIKQSLMYTLELGARCNPIDFSERLSLIYNVALLEKNKDIDLDGTEDNTLCTNLISVKIKRKSFVKKIKEKIIHNLP